MVYVIMGIFIALGFVNIYKGTKVVIRPGINMMDIVALIFVAVIFLAASYFIKATTSQSIPMFLSIFFYIGTSRWARGVTNNGINVIGAASMVISEVPFSQIKPIAVLDDGDYLQYPIKVSGRTSIDIQRYKKEMKDDLAEVFSKNKVIFKYK